MSFDHESEPLSLHTISSLSCSSPPASFIVLFWFFALLFVLFLSFFPPFHILPSTSFPILFFSSPYPFFALSFESARTQVVHNCCATFWCAISVRFEGVSFFRSDISTQQTLSRCQFHNNQFFLNILVFLFCIFTTFLKYKPCSQCVGTRPTW